MASNRQPKESGSYRGLCLCFLLVKMAANLDNFQDLQVCDSVAAMLPLATAIAVKSSTCPYNLTASEAMCASSGQTCGWLLGISPENLAHNV